MSLFDVIKVSGDVSIFDTSNLPEEVVKKWKLRVREWCVSTSESMVQYEHGDAVKLNRAIRDFCDGKISRYKLSKIRSNAKIYGASARACFYALDEEIHDAIRVGYYKSSESEIATAKIFKDWLMEELLNHDPEV